jgi:hypothetical protein
MDATLASSYDGGRSFQNARVSSQSFDAQVGSSAGPQLPVDFGSRLALASTNGRSLAAWTDTRLGSVDTGRQDIFAAGYDVPGPPGGIARVPVVLVLALVALVWAVAAMNPKFRQRRSP